MTLTDLVRRLVALILLTVLAMAGTVAPLAAQATPTAATDAITIIGGADTPVMLTVAEVQALPAETLEVTYTASGAPQRHTYTGTSLLGVLESVGLPWDADARNPWLNHIVLVTALDGYQVAFGGGELDPAFGDTPVYLAWAEDGASLSAEDAPLRIVVPGDTKGGRYVSGVSTIELIPVGTLVHDH